MSTNKIKKKDIESLDVVAACDDIIECLTGPPEKRMALRTASQLSLGVLKIYEKQVKNLEHDCRELLKSIIENKDGKQTSQKSIPSSRELTEQNLIDMFPTNRKDTHQIVEVTLPKANIFDAFPELPSFFDNNEYQASIDLRLGPAHQIITEIPAGLGALGDDSSMSEIRFHQATSVGERDFGEATSTDLPEVPVTPSRHPKRKSTRPHNETPTKKKPGKLADRIQLTPSRPITGIPTAVSSPSESARSPIQNRKGHSRRSLMVDFTEYADTADVPTTEASIPTVYPEGGEIDLLGVPQAFADRFSPPTDTIPLPTISHVEQALETGIVTHENLEPMDVDVPTVNARESLQDDQLVINDNEIQEQNIVVVEREPPQDVIEAPNEDLQNDLPPPPMPVPPVIPPSTRQDHFELEELDVTALDVRRRHSRNRRLPFLDEETQIRLEINANIHTKKSASSTLVKKSFIVPAKVLLTTPCTRLSMVSNLKNKPYCIWAAPLYNNFSKILEARESRNGMPRSFSPSASRRFTELDIHRTLVSRLQSSTNSSTQQASPCKQQALPAVQALPQETSNAPEPHEPLPDVSTSRHVEMTVTPPNISHLNIPTEPQPLEVEDAFPDEVLQQPVEEIATEPRSHRQLKSRSSSTMTPHYLKNTIEKLWMIAESYIQDKNEDTEIVIELDDVIPPTETSVVELITCLYHLSRMEKDSILELRQDEPYDKIYIIKEKPDRDSDT